MPTGGVGHNWGLSVSRVRLQPQIGADLLILCFRTRCLILLFAGVHGAAAHESGHVGGFWSVRTSKPDKIASTLVPKARPRDRKHNFRRPARYHICPREHDEPSSEVAVLDHSTNFLFQSIEFCSIRQLLGMGRGSRFHPLWVRLWTWKGFWDGGKPRAP